MTPTEVQDLSVPGEAPVAPPRTWRASSGWPRRWHRLLSRVSLRMRLTLLSALAVAVALAGIATTAYVAVSHQLTNQQDQQLQSQVTRIVGSGRFSCFPQPDNRQLSPLQVQLVDPAGHLECPYGAQVASPTSYVSVASGSGSRSGYTTLADGTPVRYLAVHAIFDDTVPVAIVATRDVTDDQHTLNMLRLLLFAAGGVGILVAAGGGLVVARSGLRPVDRLTAAAEHIAATEELDVPIEVTGSDELARLANAFNAMTSALSHSRIRQQQLVADAGHELRTPLTSLRTNLDLLIRMERSGRELPPGERERLLEDLSAQMTEMAALVAELVNLARDDRSVEPTTTLEFAAVVERAADRARLRAGDPESVVVHAEPWLVQGRAQELERAVVNLLDNAVKFSPAGTAVEVSLRDGRLEIADRGPGVSEIDRPHVFERFYRSAAARGMPGSGLGLAIVAQTVAGHGGTVELVGRPGGGTIARVRLPGQSPAWAAPHSSTPGLGPATSDQPDHAS